jgi:pimeloyl-ACP methyl ester carboxylesterase
MKVLRLLLLAAAAILVMGGCTVLVWASSSSAPMPQALAALQSDDKVEVSTNHWLTFRPRAAEPSTGLIIYPGAKVDARSYAPTARAIAEQGYQVVIVPMPFNLAFFGSNAAADVINAYPTIQHWAIAGHSLGGILAAGFAGDHMTEVAGLIFWASYPSNQNNLSSRPLPVLSIYGTRDGIVTADNIANSRHLLPADTTWVAIVGGNHAQFGWYGPQQGDQPATISREQQTQEVIDATVGFLKSLG